MQVAIVPRDDITFTDGWYVQGLKGTGSYDYNAVDVFVPQYRTFPLFSLYRTGALARGRMGLMPVTAAGHALGARGCQEHARRCRGVGRHEVPDERLASLASRPTFQKGLAHHVASWRAARLLVLDAFTQAEAAVAAGDELTRRCARTCGWPPSTPPTPRGRVGSGPSGGGHEFDPRGQQAGARLPRPLHRHAARVHQREGGHRRGTDLARHHRGPARTMTGCRTPCGWCHLVDVRLGPCLHIAHQLLEGQPQAGQLVGRRWTARRRHVRLTRPSRSRERKFWVSIFWLTPASGATPE